MGRVTTKGQVTIPQEIREKLGLHAATEVEFLMEGNAVRLRRARGGKSRGERLVARLRGRAERRLSTDQILRLTR